MSLEARIDPKMSLETLFDAYHTARMITSQRARWGADHPDAEPNTCRYCGSYWRRWMGSKLDGHAACVVTEDFKQGVLELLQSPAVTYTAVAKVIGVTPSVVRSWTFPTRRVRRNM